MALVVSALEHMTEKEIRRVYGGMAPEDAPAYTIADAARFLHLPYSTLRFWISGGEYPTSKGTKAAPPVIEPATPTLLSFRNLAEAHVLKALRRQHHISMPSLRLAITYVRREFEIPHPLVDPRVAIAGAELLAERYGALVSASQQGQLAMQVVLKAHLKRLEWYQGKLRCLYPFVWVHRRVPSEDEPRIVFISPTVAFGRPVIPGQIRTSIVNERFEAGEGVSELAADYDRPTHEIEEAIRYERVVLYQDAA